MVTASLDRSGDPHGGAADRCDRRSEDHAGVAHESKLAAHTRVASPHSQGRSWSGRPGLAQQ